MRAQRRLTRKRGLTIENVLLGMIAILVFSGLLYGASAMVMRDVRNIQAARVLPPAVSEIRRIFSYKPDYAELDNDLVIDSGVIPADMLNETDRRIMMPYDGSVEFSGSSGGGNFTAIVTWPSGRTMERSLCTRLTVDQGHVSSGPLGENYQVVARDCLSDAPWFEVSYDR